MEEGITSTDVCVRLQSIQEMTSNQLDHLIEELQALPQECEWVEFKHNNKDPEKLGENLSAIANAALLEGKSKGYIVYGVEDSTHRLVGTSFNPDVERIRGQELKNYILTQLEPSADFTIYKHHKSGYDIVIIEIDVPNNYPQRFKDVPYIRIGSYTKKLQDHPEKEKKLWSKINAEVFETGNAGEQLEGSKALEYIDYPSVFRYLSLGVPTSQKVILEKLVEEKLLNYTHGLYAVSNLGAILFAYDLSHFPKLERKKPRVIIYEGKSKIKGKREVVFNEGYAVNFKDIVDYINSQLPTNEEIGRAFRQDVRIYPEIAIRELVANALIHQDFSVTGAGVMIELFNNRLEITNPGKPIIDTKRFIDHSPESRNESLARFMRRINICEERGSGIDKVVSAVEAYQLPAPDFTTGSSYTTVKMLNPKSLRQMTSKDRIRATYQHTVLKYITGDYMSNKTIRKRFGIEDSNYPQASRIIKLAIEDGVIKEYENTKSYIPFWAD